MTSPLVEECITKQEERCVVLRELQECTTTKTTWCCWITSDTVPTASLLLLLCAANHQKNEQVRMRKNPTAPQENTTSPVHNVHTEIEPLVCVCSCLWVCAQRVCRLEVKESKHSKVIDKHLSRGRPFMTPLGRWELYSTWGQTTEREKNRDRWGGRVSAEDRETQGDNEPERNS